MTEPTVPRHPRAWPSGVLAALLTLAAAVAILSTARTFSGTVDEPAHIAAGLQWLSTGAYDYDLQHPPLGRIAASLGPYLHGARTTGAPGVFDEGARILGSGVHYVNTLASARHGVIVFFFLFAWGVWLWAKRLAGEAGGLAAVLLLVANPAVLAHAGLATTDVACAATTTLALYAGVRWLEKATLARAATFGIATGIAVGSRLSAIAFVGAGFVLCYLTRVAVTRRWSIKGSRPFAGAATALIIALFEIWAAYRFSFGPLHPGGPSVPAPAFVAGIGTFFLHGSAGHPTFLLGKPSNRGWWYYYPVALLVKTPLPLLLATAWGVAVVVRRCKADRDWAVAMPLAAAIAILAVSLAVHVDLGVRLVLPVYPLMAIVGALGAADAWRTNGRRATRVLAAIVLAWSALVAVRAYPDELSYFNPLAGAHPEHVLVDSNLDWGQDLYRLRDSIAARHITDTVRVAYFGTADLEAAGVPRARLLGLHEHTTGWIAASETFLAGEWVGHAYQWLLAYPPVARIGPSMRLWYIPPAAATRDSSRRSVQ